MLVRCSAMAKKEFNGALAEPIEIIECIIILTSYYDLPDRNLVLETAYQDNFDINNVSPAMFSGCPAMKEWFLILHEKREEKYHLLANEFGIDLSDKNAWQDLAKQLASAYVPGFRVAAKKLKKGAPKKYYFLYRDIEDLKEKGHSIKNACRLLVKRKNTEYYGVNPDTLEQRYYEIISKTKRILKDIDSFKMAPEIEEQLNRIRSKYWESRPTHERSANTFGNTRGKIDD